MAKRTIVTQYAPGVSFGVSGEGYKLEMEALATLESAVRAVALPSPVLFVIGPVVEVLAEGDVAALASSPPSAITMAEQVGHA